MVLGGAYSLWLFNRISYGNLKTQFLGNIFLDLNKNEFYSLLPLIIGTLFMGIYPEIFLTSMHLSLLNLII